MSFRISLQVLIRYIDYGNTENVPVTALVSLPQSLKEVPYAVKYKIANLQAVGDDAVELKVCVSLCLSLYLST